MDNLNRVFKVTVILAVMLLSSRHLFAQPELSTSNKISQTGYFQLKWKFGEGGTFILQQDSTLQFNSPETIYTGNDKARTVSGMLNGDYYYRVRTVDGDWSNTVMVTVEHYKVSTAFFFLGLGAIVFLATATLIIGGHFTQHKVQNDNNR